MIVTERNLKNISGNQLFCFTFFQKYRMQLKSLFMLLFNSLLSTKYTVTIAPCRDSLKSSLILQTTWNILN